MNSKFLIFLLACFLFFPAGAQKKTYTNPVISGFNPDPSVCRVGDDYYLVTSSFCYFPGLPVYHSKNLIDWKLIGYGLHRSSQVDLRNTKIWSGIYAATIRHHRERFYIITTNTKHNRNFIITAANPSGPWSDPVTLPFGGYDPSLYFEGDKAFVTWTGHYKDSHGILQSEINVETGELVTDPRVVFYDPEYYGAEGPHLYKISGQYYLMIAHGGTAMGHRESIFRANSPYGPFQYCPENPILRNTFYRDMTIQSAGHAELFEDHNGNWWLAFLGIRNFGGFAQQISLLGRETHLAPVHWENGWPVLYNQGKIPLKIETDQVIGDPAQSLLRITDHFKRERLSPQWNFMNNPEPGFYRLESEKSRLILLANGNNLDSLGQKALIMQRQKNYFFEAETGVLFEPEKEEHEAGITLFMARNYHYDLFITRRNNRKVLVARRRIDDIDLEEKVIPAETGQLTLKVTGNPWQYTFYAGQEDDFMKIASMNNWFITIHTVGEYYTGFTGMFLGLFAVGHGQQAYFDRFHYEQLPVDMKSYRIAKFEKEIK